MNGSIPKTLPLVLPGVYLSGQSWSLAPGGRGPQLGQMPDAISEWNGARRDTVRRALNTYGQRGGDATRAASAGRIGGSADLFGDSGEGRGRPW